jgi:protein SCO1/2
VKPSSAIPVATILLLAVATGAQAGLTKRELYSVSLAPPLNSAVPLELEFRDSKDNRVTLGQAIAGRPAILLFVDYTCRTICGPALAIASGALSQTGLDPATDFRLVVVGLDAKDNVGDARTMSRQIGDAAVEHVTTLLLGDAATTRRLTEAVGYSYEYDPGTDQFAHPAGALVLTAAGRVSRVLSSLALNPQDLRLSLVEAGKGRVGKLGDRLTLLCYGFDAMHGVYTPAIGRILRCLAALTLMSLFGFILILKRKRGMPGVAR